MPSSRRIENLLGLTALYALRERVSARLRFPNRKAQFEAICAERKRDRLFVVGNAPSLRDLNLDHLDGEDYFLVKMAEHLPWSKNRTHPYYIAADKNVLEKYENGRPSLEARHYFLAATLERHLNQSFVAAKKPFFFDLAKGGVRKRGMLAQPWIAVASGQTILLSAVEIGWALGYREIYVIGCDLDYSGPDPYAYRTTDVERERGQRDDSKMRERTNEQFAILRQAIEKQGGLLANAGEGGRLDTLPRVGFSTLFS